MNHELMDKAMQNFDVCVEKHTYSLKNALYGMINHAYKRGLEDGKQLANKQVEESAIEAAFQQGYDKGVAEKPSEIMKKYDEGYRKGLENNCAAMLMGQERGQKQLLDALNVIAEKHGTKGNVLLSYIRNDTPESIIEAAKHIVDKKENDDDKIHVGDEVYWVDDDGKESFNDTFIVTALRDGHYIAGIDSDGDPHFHDEDLHNWHKTGRHIDILGFMNRME